MTRSMWARSSPSSRRSPEPHRPPVQSSGHAHVLAGIDTVQQQNAFLLQRSMLVERVAVARTRNRTRNGRGRSQRSSSYWRDFGIDAAADWTSCDACCTMRRPSAPRPAPSSIPRSPRDGARPRIALAQVRRRLPPPTFSACARSVLHLKEYRWSLWGCRADRLADRYRPDIGREGGPKIVAGRETELP